MARRKVTVELELEVARANRSAAELALTLRGTKARLEDLGDEADGVSRDLDQLAANTDLAKTKIDDLGDEARGSARDLELLDSRISATEKSVRRLGVEFARTGDEAAGKQHDQESSLLGRLKKLRKELADLEPSPNDNNGKRSFKIPSIDFSNSVGEARGALITALVAAIAMAAPAIGAALAGAVGVALGGAGIAGAIFSASKNDQVRSAASDFGKSISGMFFGGGDSYIIVQSILDSLAILKSGFEDLHLTDTFEIVAPYMEVLAKALADSGRVFMPEFNKALAAARPILGMFARELPTVAFELAHMFRVITESKGSVMGILFLMNWLGNAIGLLGLLVAGLSDTFAWLVHTGASVTDWLSKLPVWLAGAAPFFDLLNDGIQGFIDRSVIGTETSADLSRAVGGALKKSVESTEEAVKRLNDAFEEQYRIQHDLITGHLDYQQALDDLSTTLDQNGAAWGETTQAGRDNERQVLANVDAAKRLRDEMIAGGMDTATANLIYQDNINKVVEMAKAYGLDETAVRNFITALAGVPPVTTAQLILEMEAHGILPGEHSGVRVGDNPDYHTDYVPPDAATAALAKRAEGRRAAGGPVLAGRLYGVNEQRMEYFRPAMDGWVMPLGQASPGAASGSGSGPLVVENHIEVGGEVVRVVRTEISTANRATARRVTAGLPA